MASIAPAAIPQSTLELIRDEVSSHLDAIKSKKATDVVGRYFLGHHRLVFDLKSHPDYILKIQRASDPDAQERLSAMFNTIQKCQNLIKENGWNQCVVPAVSKVTLNEKQVLWIEKKLDGIFDPTEARDASEKVFVEMRENQDLYNQWKETFLQTAHFIAETGYSDVDWRNLLFMEKGIGFIDFEQISEDPKEKAHGLFRLLKIAPLEFIDPILEVVEKNHLQKFLFSFCVHLESFSAKGFNQLTSYKDAVKMLKEIRQEELALNATILSHHQKMGINDPQKKIDASKYEENSLERATIEKFHENLENTFYKSPIEIRTLFWQPFVGEHRDAFTSDSTSTRQKFEAALEQLKKDEVIALWKRTPNQYQECCDEYYIYF